MWLYIVHYLSAANIAKQLCISKRTVRRYISSYETTGDVESRTYTHGPPKLLGDFEQLVLLKIIAEDVGLYLHEIQAKLLAMYGVSVTTATICRTLKFMGCTR